ncbi:MAG: hypothetical protein HQL87_14860, partial [Magnetococcales bacterium]|nr:hypothetical protein [Magnetococcales bacterium]
MTPSHRPHSPCDLALSVPERAGCAVGGIYAPGGIHMTEILAALQRMEHRGSGLPDAAGRFSGDGAGVLLRLPEVANRWLAQLRPDWPGVESPWEKLGVGLFFLPPTLDWARNLMRQTEEVLQGVGLVPLAWRTVPTDPDKAALGVRARASMPAMHQLFVAPPPAMGGETFEQHLYLARRRLESLPDAPSFYIASLSCRLLNYKGMLTSTQFADFFPDLTASGAEAMVSNIVLFHRRFSTNTYPDWTLAQPFRLLAHNGEINAIAANRGAVHNIERVEAAHPEQDGILMPGGSDSADLDRVLEHQYHHVHNQDLALTLLSLIPPAWRADARSLSPQVIRYYQYFMFRFMSLGQWEGPAGVVTTDGRVLVAKEDRIGLRPLRWLHLDSGRVIVTSEIGAFPVDNHHILAADKLGSGQIMQVDHNGQLRFDAAVLKANLAHHPGLQTRINRLHTVCPEIPPCPVVVGSAEAVRREARRQGFTHRHEQIVEFFLTTGGEPTAAMGKPAPAAGLTLEPASLYDYFLQKFAQITNPPIDFIREKKFFDLHIHIGDRSGDVGVELASPNLTPSVIAWLEQEPGVVRLDATFSATEAGADLAARCQERLDFLLHRIREGIAAQVALFILHDDDRAPDGTAIPGPLLIAFLHRALIAAGLRHQCALILKLKDMREPHDMAVNIAHGANAVHATLLWQMAGCLVQKMAQHQPAANVAVWWDHLGSGMDKALLKIMSKCGVTSTAGYRSSQLFMPFGLGEAVQEILGRSDPYAMGGRTLTDILAMSAIRAGSDEPKLPLAWDEDKILLHQAALQADPAPLARMEQHRARPFKPLHLLRFNLPEPVLSIAAASGGFAPNPTRGFAPGPHQGDDPPGPAELLQTLPAHTFRETPAEIVARYLVGAAMSHGALKEIPHQAIAAAFNHLGGRSNCGEGGESPDRDAGPWHSKIRQVASGRFGVDARYLVHAEELQIKIAQGAKPGEGGQLMGVKVDELIARNRHCAPGTTLISPQTHHDIYSIEDLQQLIHDLRAVNPRAALSVKIAAETGIGVIAVGVAKMGADILEIDGLDGGTGATPESSRDHAAHYAELGVAEVHQTLTRQGIRGSIRLRAAGGVKCGADVVKYMLLGADEVALGTALMVAQGCIACAQCYTGQCPMAITGTPRRDKGEGGPSPGLEERTRRVTHYLLALAQDAARIAGELGVARLGDLTGCTHWLRAATPEEHPLMAHLNLDFLLQRAVEPATAGGLSTSLPGGAPPPVPRTMTQNLALLARARESVLLGKSLTLRLELASGDLSFGATLAGFMAQHWPGGYPVGKTIRVRATGYGGQKLGFALVGGLAIELAGPANDGPGSAMSGGVLVIAPVAEAAEGWVNAGNAVGYGAFGGEIDVLGRVGERCAIRNSGASIVVGGAHDFLAEYQTGGETICLSPPGREVGAGMT